MAALWYIPSSTHDAPSKIYAFTSQNGMRHIRALQIEVDNHLALVRDLCNVPVDEMHALEEGTVSRHRRTEILRKQASRLLAKKCIDKPNVHRLLELAYTTLPMMGHISRVDELVLEKCHQSLKRAIHQSNNKDIQLFSMSTAMFNDWEGRLNMQVKNSLSGDSRAIIGCFRLLAGREAIVTSKGNLDEAQKQNVLQAFGPISCIPNLLECGRGSVVSSRALSGFHDDSPGLFAEI